MNTELKSNQLFNIRMDILSCSIEIICDYDLDTLKKLISGISGVYHVSCDYLNKNKYALMIDKRFDIIGIAVDVLDALSKTDYIVEVELHV